MLKGNFFDGPGRTPIYPFFVAGCYAIFGRSPESVVYVQAFLGATIIPLTFILARRFTGAQSSLVFATVASLWLFYFDSFAYLCRSSLQREPLHLILAVVIATAGELQRRLKLISQ